VGLLGYYMGVNKTISLDAQTALIADRMPNFSQFVRNALLKHARTASIPAGTVHVAPETARVWGETQDKCNPKHKSGACMLCWGDE
tara:strand:+ start:332 stop:589 length:258 start_codon:yes stop_codon:yes gene_type:complete